MLSYHVYRSERDGDVLIGIVDSFEEALELAKSDKKNFKGERPPKYYVKDFTLW